MADRLINEKSAFLKEFADSGTDWHPWGDEAVAAAKAADRPLFVCICSACGYGSYLLRKQVLPEPELMQCLNNDFVPVIVDMDERADVYAAYTGICTKINGGSGRPLIAMTLPDGRPFFVSPYMPADGPAPMLKLLRAVSEKWQESRKELVKAAEDIIRFSSVKAAGGRGLTPNAFIRAAAEQLLSSEDSDCGGFGKGAKFPMPQSLLFLLRYSAVTDNKDARQTLENALRQMYRGGIFDHIGGGFFRCSADREWLRPDFEKRLSENALLAYVYTEAWENGRMNYCSYVAQQTLDFCLRELRGEEGFVSSLSGYGEDGDGIDYLLTPDSVAAVLGAEDGKGFCECYDIEKEGNCGSASVPNLLLNDRWNLLPKGYDGFRKRLRQARDEKRLTVKDNKVLTGANGLLLMALAKAGRCFGRDDYLAEAEGIAELLMKLSGRETVPAVMYGNEECGGASLADCAFAGLGLAELACCTGSFEYAAGAAAFAGYINAHFADGYGGFNDFEASPVPGYRCTGMKDEEMPAGSGAALMLLRKLAAITGRKDFETAAELLSEHAARRAGGLPAGFAFGLCTVLGEAYGEQLILCASPDEAEPELYRSVASRYSPLTTLILKTPANAAVLAEVCPASAECIPAGENAAFYMLKGGKFEKL